MLLLGLATGDVTEGVLAGVSVLLFCGLIAPNSPFYCDLQEVVLFFAAQLAFL